MGGQKPGGLTITAAVILFWPWCAVASDGIEPIGISMQSQARGGADVAVGYSANHL